MKATKANMKEQVGEGCTDRRILHCPCCNAEYSGNAGDYFMVPENHVFTCECGETMELVHKEVRIRYIG